MPRLYIPSSRARQQVLAGGRAPRLKEQKDENYRENTPRKRRGGGRGVKHSVLTPFKARSTKMIGRGAADEQSTTSGMDTTDGEDAEDEDDNGDDGDDGKPEANAPSRSGKVSEAGRYQYDRSDDNLSEVSYDNESMFGESFNPEAEAALQSRLLDDNDDDDAYQAVDDISESDLDDERILEEQAKLLLADVTCEELGADEDDPYFYVNHIEGLSAYGFGDGSDESMLFPASSQSSDSGQRPFARHVRFEETFPEAQVFRGFFDSPTMTRALLPSALPDVSMHELNSDPDERNDSEPGDEADSDLTDDDLPEAALRSSLGEEHEQPEAPEEHEEHEDHEEHSYLDPLPDQLRAPPLGRFVDDGSQSAGVLDSTGNLLLITNPQSLGEEFARRYGVSAPPSPGFGFNEAVFGGTPPNHVLSDFHGSDFLPLGPSTRVNTAVSDPAMGVPFDEPRDEDGSLFSDMDEGECLMRIEDIVAFDSDSDDGFPTSPIHYRDLFSSPGISHLNNDNVMAFRRNADPIFHTTPSSPMINHAGARAARLSNALENRRGKKRKAEPYSPYSNTCYKGVTPVQRVSHPGDDSPLPEPTPTKRRRTN